MAQSEIAARFASFLDELSPMMSEQNKTSSLLLSAIMSDDGDQLTKLLTNADSRHELLLSSAAIERRRDVLVTLQKLINNEQLSLASFPAEVTLSPICLAIQRALPKSIDALLRAGVTPPTTTEFTKSRVWEQQQSAWGFLAYVNNSDPDDWLHQMFMSTLPLETRAALLAHSDVDLGLFRRMFLALRQRSNTVLRFGPTRDVLEQAFLQQILRKRAQMFALLEVLRKWKLDGKLVLSKNRPSNKQKSSSSSSNSDSNSTSTSATSRSWELSTIEGFMLFYCRLPHLCREFVVRHLFAPVLYGVDEQASELVIALDTVRVEMRARILNRERTPNGERVFITYENWTNNYDEWMPIDSSRLMPWREPSLLAFNTLTNPENEWGVKLTQIAQWTAFYENQFKLKAH